MNRIIYLCLHDECKECDSKYTFALGGTGGFAGVYLTTMSSPVMGEWYARTVYPVFSAVLSRFSALFPFSIGDCFIYGSIAGLVIYLVYAIVKRRPWLRTIGRMAEFCFGYMSGFIWPGE